MTATEILVPIKAFADAKQRLLIRPQHRIELMKRMASGLLTSSANLRKWVVCDDEEVAAWAKEIGASVLYQQASGLSEAVQLSMERLGSDGVKRVIVAHGDLPLLCDLERFVDVCGVVAVPNLRGLGTKVLSVPTDKGFRFAYGTTSASAHQAETERCNLSFETVRDPKAGFDINTIDDLRKLERQHPTTFHRLTNKLDIFSQPYEPQQGRPS